MRCDLEGQLAIISLSSGILGENFCNHQRIKGESRLKKMKFDFLYTPNALKGIEYLKNNPDKRASDLIWAWKNPQIKVILNAIGGNDTFKTVDLILSDPKKVEILKKNFKFFVGYSDTTINHLMLNLLGIKTYYGISFLTCICELDKKMLSYTKRSFLSIFKSKPIVYKQSKFWWNERNDFSIKQLNTSRIKNKEKYGFQLLQGNYKFQGILIGGCIESLASLLDKKNNLESYLLNQKYHLFDSKTDFKNKVLLLETSEEKLAPNTILNMLCLIEKTNIFSQLNGVIIGKPQDEIYYQELKLIFEKFFKKYPHLSVLYNVNIGHSYPKMLLELGGLIKVDVSKGKIISKF